MPPASLTASLVGSEMCIRDSARDAARFLDGLGDQAPHLVQVDVAGHELGEGIGDGHDGLAEVLTLDASGTIESTGACELSFLH